MAKILIGYVGVCTCVCAYSCMCVILKVEEDFFPLIYSLILCISLFTQILLA